MRYLTRTALIISALILFSGAFAATASAQRHGYYYPSVRIHRYYDPFWRGTLWDPHYYWYGSMDPYYWEMRERYYDRKSVGDAQRKLRKDREKFYADGYLDPKEAEKLRKDQEKYSKAVNNFNKHRYD